MLFVSFVYCTFAQQQQVSIPVVKKVAVNTLSMKSTLLGVSEKSEIDTVWKKYDNNGNLLLIEVVFSNSAAVLLSGTTAHEPVLGYYKNTSGKSIFDTLNSEIPDGLRLMLQSYCETIKACYLGRIIDSTAPTKWQSLQKAPAKNASKANAIVGPLLKTAWGQSKSYYGLGANDHNYIGDCDAYNYYVTETNTSKGNKVCDCNSYGKCPIGCGGVAMGQVMNYWKHPAYIPNRQKQFDWCNMPDTLLYAYELSATNTVYNPNYEKERNAIAHLLYECATAANVNFCISGKCASYTSPGNVRRALEDFGYSQDASLKLSSSYILPVWKVMLKADLDRGWPVIYISLAAIENAHIWVCDGYDTDDKFHFNWGWGGSWDGYYPVNGVGSIGSGENESNYNVSQQAIFGIRPAEQQDYCNLSFPLWLHYILGGTHQNTPKTFMMLESAPITYPPAWRTIKTGANVIYEAHKSIKLNPGFKVEPGASFKTKINPCKGCD